MIQAMLIKILLQFGSTFIVNLLQAGVDKLNAHSDNTLDKIGADTIKIVLNSVDVSKVK